MAAGTEAMTEARRVVEPDLLWIESVTDRLLGTAGRPAAWERVYFEGRETFGATPADEPVAAEQPDEQPAGPSAENLTPAGPDAAALPQRTPREFDGPVSYRQPAGYVPLAAVDPLSAPPPVNDPAATSEDHDVSAAEPQHQEPTVSAEPSPLDLAPAEPRLDEIRDPALTLAVAPEPDPAETPRTEDMPPAVLRAALRDALPDVLGLPAASGPADAVFGDPRWNLPAEESGDDIADEPDAADEMVPDLTGEDADRLRAAAAAEPAEDVADEQAYADEPVQSPYFDPPDGDRTGPAPAYADLGYGFPRPSDHLTVADVALRLAFRSKDPELAEAVVRLVAWQARERSRLQTAEAYLDAILDEGDAALPGAARLRHILGD